MLFEKFVEQHGVHLVVTHAIGVSFLVAHHQIRIHFFHFLGYKSELRDALRINLLLVAEGHWFKGKNCFAGLIHWLDIIFKPPGGGHGAKLTG